MKQISQNVEELVSQPLLALTRARQFSFHGMGREDVDVRMYIVSDVCVCVAACIVTRKTGWPLVVLSSSSCATAAAQLL